MTTIRQLLLEKGDKVYLVGPTDPIYDAIRKMAEENIGCLVVMEGETLKGIITERQYARHVALSGPVSPTTRVLDIMETTIIYAQPEQSVAECMAVMTNRRVRHLPVSGRARTCASKWDAAFSPHGSLCNGRDDRPY
jgi:CBS domain-containing protein